MKINILSLGKLTGEYSAICAEFVKMIKWAIKEQEITYSQKLPTTQIKQFEAKLITKALIPKAYNIILDVEGKPQTSLEFSKFLKELEPKKDISFIIGGAYGLDESVKSNANDSISLSKMTFTHKFAKIMLLEQIYRAQSILENHPYHK